MTVSLIGFVLGAAVTIYLFYRKGKKKAAELQQKVNNPEGSNKNSEEGEDEL